MRIKDQKAVGKLITAQYDFSIVVCEAMTLHRHFKKQTERQAVLSSSESPSHGNTSCGIVYDDLSRYRSSGEYLTIQTFKHTLNSIEHSHSGVTTIED